MRPEDVYALTSVGDPRLSPDGRRVAYVVSRIDERRTPTAARSGSRRSTAPRSRDSSPRASGATARPAGLPTDAGSPSSPTATARTRRRRRASSTSCRPTAASRGKLTDGKESVESIAWSPDSSRIAFARRVRDEAYEEEDDRQPARRGGSRASSTSSTASAGPATAASTSSSSASTAATSGSSPTATARTTRRRGRPTASGSSSPPCAATAGTSSSQEALYELEVDAEGAEPKRLTAGRRGRGHGLLLSPTARASPTSTRPRTARIRTTARSPSCRPTAASAASSPRRSTGTARRTRAAREPVWDGDRIVFGVEDGGNVHIYAVAADGSSEPELLVGGEQSIGLYDLVDGVLVYTASTHDAPARALRRQRGRR